MPLPRMGNKKNNKKKKKKKSGGETLTHAAIAHE